MLTQRRVFNGIVAETVVINSAPLAAFFVYNIYYTSDNDARKENSDNKIIFFLYEVDFFELYILFVVCYNQGVQQK